MKIKATQQLEVEISPEEQKKVALEYIYRNFNWGDGFYIAKERNEIFKTIHHYQWEESIAIREAEPLDYSVEIIVNQIKTYLPK